MRASEFLKSVLGEDGAEALARAHRRAPTIGAVMAPRAIVSWLTTAIRLSYEGEIPGVPNSYIALKKSEHGFSGDLTIADKIHSFANADLLHVAASIGVALGIDDTPIDPMLKTTDLSKLGQSIDLLVKAKIVTKAVTENLVKPNKEESSEDDEIEKIETPGKQASPKMPIPAQPPNGPQAIAPSTNKVKLPVTKKELVVTKSESEHECRECGFAQFKQGRFTGCMCFRALAKSVKTTVADGFYRLQVNGLDSEEFQALVHALKG